MRHSSCRFAEPGSYQTPTPAFVTAPALQRTTPLKKRRAALRPGNERRCPMPAILLVPPSAEPWSVAEAKAFLRVEHDDDDAVIAALIAAARGQVEALSRRALLVQRWRLVLDAWPSNGRLDPRMGPLRSLIAARVFDAAGN